MIPIFPNGLFTAEITPQNLEWLFNFMTREDTACVFIDMISMLHPIDLHHQFAWFAYLVTSNSDHFLKIALNEYRSKHMQILLGRSEEVDAYFSDAILGCFHHVMSNQHSSYVALRGLQVFNEVKKKLIYSSTLQNVIDLALDQHGCLALTQIITSFDNPIFKECLVETIGHKALRLSNDLYGSFVVQNVLNLGSTQHIVLGLHGRCVDLSFSMYGGLTVQKLLECAKEPMIEELLGCDGDKLVKLATNEFGNHVVAKALNVTNNDPLLVDKLMPLLHLLRTSSPAGSNIASILEGFVRSDDTSPHMLLDYDAETELINNNLMPTSPAKSRIAESSHTLLDYDDEEDAGIHLDPDAIELINSYLIPKLQGEPCGDFIETKDVYAKEPWSLEHTKNDLFLKDQWYYFVTRDQTSKLKMDRGKNVKRVIKDGKNWQAYKRENIKDEIGNIIGTKQKLTFKRKEQNEIESSSVLVPGSDSSWIMTGE